MTSYPVELFMMQFQPYKLSANTTYYALHVVHFTSPRDLTHEQLYCNPLQHEQFCASLNQSVGSLFTTGCEGVSATTIIAGVEMDSVDTSPVVADEADGTGSVFRQKHCVTPLIQHLQPCLYPAQHSQFLHSGNQNSAAALVSFPPMEGTAPEGK